VLDYNLGEQTKKVDALADLLGTKDTKIDSLTALLTDQTTKTDTLAENIAQQQLDFNQQLNQQTQDFNALINQQAADAAAQQAAADAEKKAEDEAAKKTAARRAQQQQQMQNVQQLYGAVQPQAVDVKQVEQANITSPYDFKSIFRDAGQESFYQTPYRKGGQVVNINDKLLKLIGDS